MDESPPIAIFASQELLKAAPCIVPGSDSDPGSDSVSVSDSGMVDGESFEDFRLSFSNKHIFSIFVELSR